jgi:hypothetical protein
MTRLIRSYFFWSYERGSFHYDVMVTAILLFVFVSPHVIDFKDKPVTTVPLHGSEVLVKEASGNSNEARFVYEVRAEDLDGASTDVEIRRALLSVIEPISGEVKLEQYKPVPDTKGKIVAYDATVLRSGL